MARIRTVKPDFWDDEKVGSLSLGARLLIIGIWNYCDDVGVARATPTFLKAKIFPYDTAISIDQVGEWLDELSTSALLLVAKYNGETFLLVKNFLKHQKIDKPSKTKSMFDTYEENLSFFEANRGVIVEDSTRARGGLAVGLGVHSHKGVHRGRDIAPPPKAPVEEVIPFYCDRYKEKYGHHPVIGKKQAGILNRFRKNHPSKWEDLIRGYLEMPDTWSVARSHPVEMLDNKINEIVRFLETGRVVTKKVIEHAEEMIDKAQGTSRRPRKSIEDLERERAEMLADANVVPMIAGGKS